MLALVYLLIILGAGLLVQAVLACLGPRRLIGLPLQGWIFLLDVLTLVGGLITINTIYGINPSHFFRHPIEILVEMVLIGLDLVISIFGIETIAESRFPD